MPEVKDHLAHADLLHRFVPKAERDKLAAKGAAKPDKSFPIANAGDLASAIKLAKSDSDRLHVIKNAKKLGLSRKIPDTWNSDGTLKHSDDTPDYLGSVSYDPETDKLDHGVKGMKWGVRRSSSQLKAASHKEASTASKSTEKKTETPGSTGSSGSTSSGSSTHVTDHLSNAETSAQRYTRIQAVAKSGKAHELPDADLKFFNARTEALAKVSKMNEQQPGWLAKTTKDVVQTTAKASMQAIATAAAEKYINKRLIDQLNKPKT